MEFRKATVEDLEEVEDIYESARAFMKSNGNPDQWGKHYPPRSLILSDIEEGNLYITCIDGNAEGVFAFIEGRDPTYDYIDGAWLDSDDYCAVHRVASRGRKKGFVRNIMDYCFGRCNSIKIDTHRDNAVMQNALSKYGFIQCGIIYLENGEERLAYQMKKD